MLKRQSLLILLAGIVIALIGIPQIEKLAANREVLKPYDFVQYWSAGRQLLDGRNPYDPDELVPLQRSMYDGIRKAVMMWNPPWTLTLTLPFAALPWRLAQLLWLGMQMTAVLLSADLLWRIYGGNVRYRWISWLIALTFAPTLFLLLMGQISGLLLLGVSGFLYFLRNERPYLAGCCAAFTAIKPHLFLLFALVLLLEATRHPAIRKALLSGGITLLICGLLPLLWNPQVWSQYLASMNRPPSENFETMREFEHPTIGYQLRLLLPGQLFAAQFIPVALAALGIVVYWYCRRAAWSWERELPLLILIAVLTAGYGAWAFDLVVLLPALIVSAIALQDGRKWVLGTVAALYLVLNALVLMTIREAGSQSNPWIAPGVFLIYVALAVKRPGRGLRASGPMAAWIPVALSIW